jgi:hypothetical protein
MWFAENGQIGRISCETDAITETFLTQAGQAGSIVLGPGGDLWFNSFGVDSITTAGAVTLNPATAFGNATSLAAGADGNLWFTDTSRHQLGRMTPQATFTAFALPGPGAPTAIIAGPDGTIWYAETVNSPETGAQARIGMADLNATDAPLSASPANFAATAGQQFAGLVATFTDADPMALPGDFEATVDWGNGLLIDPTPAEVVADGHGQFDVLATDHGPAGQLTPMAFRPTTVRIFDTRLSNHVGGATATVVDTPTVLAPDLSAFSYASATVGQGGSAGVDGLFYLAPGSPGVSTLSASIDWGDGTAATAATLVDHGTVVTGAGNEDQAEASGSHAYAQPGLYHVRVALRDPSSGGIATADVLVRIAGPDGPSPSASPESFSVSGSLLVQDATLATFQDPGGPTDPAAFGASVDWGDGTTGGAAIVSIGNGSFAVLAGHLYPESGTYPVRVTIAAQGGGTTTVAGQGTVTGPRGTPDFDGDGTADLAGFLPATATWILLRSSAGPAAIQFGASGDIPVPAAYDGGGQAEIAVFHPSTSVWSILGPGGVGRAIQFGPAGSIPVPGDYDHTGRTELAVFDPRTAIWSILRPDGTGHAIQFGASGDIPVPGEYDGLGWDEPAVFHPATSVWSILGLGGVGRAVQFGGPGQIPIPADLDGVGRTEPALFEPSTSSWMVLNPSGRGRLVQFGPPGQVVPANLPLAYRMPPPPAPSITIASIAPRAATTSTSPPGAIPAGMVVTLPADDSSASTGQGRLRSGAGRSG